MTSVRPDFGDLLVAVADDLDDIRMCIACGDDSTWAGLFVHENGEVTATSWCDAPACEADRNNSVVELRAAIAVPINHLPALRRKDVDE